ncbi:MAG: MarR family transcriptional regulator [Methyloceanibacter sp.]|nr:MAG: MarR family transcriptional regulator [Methyloceanibacter sp.]
MSANRNSVEGQVIAGLSKLSQFLRTAQWRSGSEAGLTPTQMQLLRELAAKGPMRIGALAEAIGVAQPTATDAFEALRRKELVEKKSDPCDGRAVAAAITRRGRTMLGNSGGWADGLTAAIGGLDQTDQSSLLRGLTKIIRGLQVQRAIPVQRMCVTCRFFQPNVHDDPAAPHHCAFVDAAFGDASLRLDCGEHEVAPERKRSAWRRFAPAAGAKNVGASPAATNEAP